MWLVNLALRRPYTIWVAVLLVFVLGWLSYTRTPTDILPNLNVPVVVVFASYRGMPAPDMEQSVTAILERALTKCDQLEHIESRSLLGIGIVKVYFRPQVNPDLAASQVISIVNSEMQNMPPGMLPPTIMKYDATAVPVGNLVVSSASRDDKYLLDVADHQLREELAGIEGLASAPVFGGVFRQIQIYVHPRSLEAIKMSPLDVARKVNNQSQVIPTGEIRIGKQSYYVSSNAMVATPKDFEKIPLHSDGRKVIYLGDVAEVVDGQRWRTNIVHADGRRAVYMPLLRQAGASAVQVVDNVKEFLPELKKRGVLPEDVEVSVTFDQAQYVRDALDNLTHEGILGAVLAALVVLLFLGTLRGSLIVALSIPLSILFAFIGLYFTGQTLNIMTLGGLALVLGRVVDDTIVDVENTTRHLGMGKSPIAAVLASAAEIAVPVLMATVTTVVVFFPLTVMSGVGKYLFTPLAVSAGLAMFASYIVSRTVSPLCCSRFLRPHHERDHFPRWAFVLSVVVALVGLAGWLIGKYLPLPLDDLPEWGRKAILGIFMALKVSGLIGGLMVVAAFTFWLSPWFDRVFDRFTVWYLKLLELCLRRRVVVVGLLLLCIIPATLAYLDTGKELFPEVDSSEFTVHVRATGGPRVEETERQVEEIEKMLTTNAAVNCDRLMYEVALSYSARDIPYLEALKVANHGEGSQVIQQILDAISVGDGSDAAYETQRQKINEITRANRGKTFLIPPVIPLEDQDMVLSNVGLSSRWSAIYTANNGPHAAFVRVQLRSGFAGRTTPTLTYVQRLRRKLFYRWPSDDFFFETGGMIRRILNAGAVAPVEVQIYGRDNEARRQTAKILSQEIQKLSSVQDTYLPQGMDLPQLRVMVDRTRAARPNLTESDIVRNVITALMSSAQLAPNLWIDPQTGNPYVIGVQYPEYMVEDIQTLEKIPITSGPATGKSDPVLRLEDVATIERGQGPVEVFHYEVNRVSQLFVNVAGDDLSQVAKDVDHVVERLPFLYAVRMLPESKRALRDDVTFLSVLKKYVKKGEAAERDRLKTEYGVDPASLKIPKGVRVEVRGEARIMTDSFGEMTKSLLLAVLLVYLILAAQFQSWVDPLIMIVSAPLGLIGVTAMLWLTGSTVNTQSLMGVLMMVGISVSNSVLLVQFANDKRGEGVDTYSAIAGAARVRLRPIIMTSVAAIFGLLPMAIHLRPGDEMNLPLARAVIGGLISSTLLTLFVVPVLYILLKPKGGAAVAPAEPTVPTPATT